MSDLLSAARAGRARGWWVTPVNGKRPPLERWQAALLEGEELDAALARPNVTGLGVLLGASGLVDLEGDTEAADLALAVLAPETGCVWRSPTGRRHRLYRSPADHQDWTLPKRLLGEAEDPAGEVSLVEVRAGNHQSVLPPSAHPAGGRYEWVREGEPAEADPAALTRAASLAAVAGALAPNWGRGARERLALAVAGWLRRRGVTEAEALAVVKATCRAANDEETEKRLAAVEATYAKPPGEKTTGLPALAEALGKELADWLDKTLSAAKREPTPAEIVLTRLADVQPEAVKWLWPGRVPLGKLTLLDGDPGLGKSLLTLDLAARVTRGDAMPDGEAGDVKEPAGVVILTAEDGLADTIRPRLEAAGADLERVAALEAIRYVPPPEEGTPGLPPPEEPCEVPPTLAHIAALEEAITTTSAALVIVDPLMAFMPDKVNTHKDQEVRRALAPLAKLAERTGAALLVVRHMTKAEGRNPMYRGGGSIGIIGAARSAMLVAKDPDDETGARRVLAPLKSNLAAPAPALAFTVSAPDGRLRVEWGEETAHTAASLLAQPESGEEKSAVGEAREFLRELLAEGPKPVKEIKKEAKAAGIAERTLTRAKTLEGVRAFREGYGAEGGWQWELPEQASGQRVPTSPKGATPTGLAPFEESGGTLCPEPPDLGTESNPHHRVPTSDGEMGGETVAPFDAPALLTRLTERPPAVTTKPDGLALVAAALAGAEVVALDCETTGLDPRADRIRLLSLAIPTDRGPAVHLIDCNRVDPRNLFSALAGKRLVGHNLAFDLAFLARLGFAPGKCEDTLLLARLLSAGLPEARRKGYHTLAAVAERELGVTLPKEGQKADWRGELTPALRGYAARDAAILLPLRERLAEQAREAGLEKAAAIENRCLPAVVWLAGAGVPLDAEAWERLAAETEAEAERLRAELDAAAPRPPGLDLGQGWNWNAPEQARRALAAAGAELPDTADETLAACPHPLAALLRQYRAVRTLADRYGAKWLAEVQDGRLYPDWRQLGADTGRMACRDPNLQNLPRDLRYRACVRAPEGRLLVKADYSQIELRLAAKIAGEQKMLEAFAAGEDLHTLTARAVLQRSDVSTLERSNVSREDRQLAKAVNFGLLYGMGAEGFRRYALTNYGLELTPAEASRYRSAFFQAYPGLARWHARAKGAPYLEETRTLAGRRRLRVEGLTHRLNSPVQGSGADGLKRALALLWERREECPGAAPILAAHDELVIECDAAQAEPAAEWLRRALLDGMEALANPVPVTVETRTGETWAGG